MKILFLTDNFPPERNAPASRTYEHAVEWVKAGHQVTVITTAPNFPEGRIYEGFRNRWRSEDVMDGIRVIRVWSFVAPNSGFVKRILDYVSFMVTGGMAALRAPRPDVLVSTSPQFFCAVAGWVVSRLRRLPWVFELRDLWPASIIAVGALKRNLAIRLLERLELRMYRDADAIVAVSRAFLRNLSARGIDPNKIEVVLNGADLGRYRPQPKDPGLVEQLKLQGKFVVGYLGTHGMAHALEKVVDAAALLKQHREIVFLFVGAGARREFVENLVHEKLLPNVIMLPAQPKEHMAALWSIHDLALIPLANHSLFTSVIPSKMFEAMAMGIPILMSIPEGEATNLLTECGAGVVVPPEQPAIMANTILALAGDSNRTKHLSETAINAAKGYTRAHQASLMLQILEQVAFRTPRTLAHTHSHDKAVPGRRSATELHESRAASKSD